MKSEERSGACGRASVDAAAPQRQVSEGGRGRDAPSPPSSRPSWWTKIASRTSSEAITGALEERLERRFAQMKRSLDECIRNLVQDEIRALNEINSMQFVPRYALWPYVVNFSSTTPISSAESREGRPAYEARK